MTPEDGAEHYRIWLEEGWQPTDEDLLDALRTLAEMGTVYPVQHRGPDDQYWSDRHTWLHESSARESRRQIIDRLDWPEDRIRVTRRHYVEVDITDD